jgi:hypothetical protein
MKKSLSLILAVLLAFAGDASAQTLYQDFTGPAQGAVSLGGTMPVTDYLNTSGEPITTNGGTAAEWIVNGAGAFTAGTYGEVYGNSNTVGATASLPFEPAAGIIYTLSANIAVTSGSGTGFAALGFTSSSASASSNFYGLVPGPYLQLNSYNGGVQTVSGVSHTFAALSNPGGSYTGTEFSIVLDTVDPEWTVSFYQGLTQLGTTYTYTTGNPVINDIALGTDTYDAGVYSNLTLIPEPSTWAMMFGGLALLGFCVRRKLA